MDYKEKVIVLLSNQELSKEQKEKLEGIFPELKESKEERIRKMLRAYIHDFGVPKEYFVDVETSDVIAWLEKQGDKIVDCPQNHQDVNHPNGGIVMEDFSGGEGFYKLHLDYLNKKQIEEVEEMVRTWNKESKTSDENIKNCIGMCLTDVNEQRFNNYGTTLKDCLAWLEKQHTDPYNGVCFDFYGHRWGMCARDNGIDILLDKQLFKHFEQQDEQTQVELNQSKMISDQELEPKFKVKDWVVSNSNGEVWQIGVKYTEEGQRIYLYNVNDVIMSITLDELNNDYHLWTIRDAKDGDILAEHECLVLFKQINGLNIDCYCTYHYMGFNPSFHVNTLQNKTAFHPATKEQRDTLFAKMKELGYVWDSEKKELKTIEQKTLNADKVIE